MKTILTVIAMSFMYQVSASEITQLRSGDMSLSQAQAEIVSVRPLCPSNPNGISCRATGNIVRVKVTLGGCLDSYGGHFEKFKLTRNQITLHFGAINIANKDSMVARCAKAPVHYVELMTNFEGGDVVLEKLNFLGAKASKR